MSMWLEMRDAGCARLARVVVCAAFCFALASPLGAQAKKEIILDNPSFEEAEGADTPTWWTPCVERGAPKLHMAKEAGHTGKSCLTIQSDDKDSVASWIYKGVLYVDGRNSGYTVKGGATYELSAWVRAEGVGGSPALLVWESDGKAFTASHSGGQVAGDSGWQRRSCRFTTKAPGKGLQLRLNLFGKGKVWFDDVTLEEIDESNDPGSTNLLKNGSFEITTIPGQPDDWGMSGGGSGLGGVVGAHYTEKFFDWYRIDGATAFHGRNSFRIYRPFDDSDPAAAEYHAGDFILGSDWQLSGEIEAGASYVFSCYLKGDSPGLRVTLRAGDCSREVEVATEWKRCSLAIPAAKGNNMCIHLAPTRKGTVWIDALQLEKGERPTAYAPSRKDLVAAGSEKLPPVPKMDCAKVSNPPKLDGVLDDSCYAELPKLDLTLLNGKAPKEPTEGYIFQEGGNLYIAMKCHESQMDKLRTEVKNQDGSVWEDDSVEIFIDPELSRESYYRLGLNAAGVKFDGQKLDGAWNGDWEAKTFKGKDFWSLEMKIPLNAFGVTPTMGGVWGMNLCRNNQVAKEYCNWSPVYDGGFHSPKRFGEMGGVDVEALKGYRYGLRDIALEPRADGKGYDVSVNLSNLTGAGRRVELEATVGNASASERLSLEDGQRLNAKLGPFQVEGKRAELITVSLSDPQSKKPLVSAAAAMVKAPLPFELVPELSYYTDEENASVFVMNNMDKAAADSGEMSIAMVLEDKDGGALLSRNLPFSSKTSSFAVSLAGLKDGDYSIHAKLMGSRGKCLGEAKESLRKLAKSPSGVKINQMNRMLVIDGEPTIPVSQFLSVFVGAGKDKEKATFFYDKVMARYGQDFNSIDICYFGDHDAIPSILDIAQKNKLKVFIESIYEFDYTKEGIAKLAPKIKDHPALLSWPAILDEVVANDKVSKQAYDRCAWINELDPRHAQFIRNHCVSFSSWGRFGYPGEIVEYHDYTFSSNRGGVAAWAPYMVAAGKVAKERRKPFLAMPQTFSSMQWWSRGPSADEMEASIYLALVNGATIVQFYTFDQAERNLWLRVRRLTKEIKELTPVLATYEEAPAVGVNSPKIQTLVKSHKGRYYLLAVNSSEEPMAVNFDLSALDLPGDATAELMFEDRAVSLKGGALQDSFAGYQRHVYALDKADAGNRSFFDCLIPW